jgi:hypothetical protein
MTAREGWPATEEDVMHPVIAQAIATERSRGLRADAAAAARARQLPRSQHGRRPWLFRGITGAVRGPASVPARRPLRDPRAA